MEAFAEELWSGQDKLSWYFLIGGPGNGKSEAVGAFVRRINALAAQAGRPPVFNPAHGQHGGSIAYDFQGQLPKGEVWLLQDVSVPKSHGSDPADDLLASLELSAEGGLHLLICANRGMLLRATRQARRQAGKEWLVKLLEAIDAASREDAQAASARWPSTCDTRTVDLRVWPLDHESVLFGQGNGNPWAEPKNSLLDAIIQGAVKDTHWESQGCNACQAKDLCPIFQDVQWLRDSQRRTAMLQLLRHAEVWSGQRIVLREALGLVSLVLVGCPSDFVQAGTEVHPCDWVQQRLAGTPAKPTNDQALLELVSHRIYQDLFSRPFPAGLALDRVHQRRDAWIRESVAGLTSLGHSLALAAKRIDNSFPKQAGPLRLVGAGGILQQFDPAKDSSWTSKHGLNADGQIAELRQLRSADQSQLEHRLSDMFQALEDEAKAVAPHKDPAKTFAAIYRWASTIYLRLAGTAVGATANTESLAEYLALLQHPTRAIQAGGRHTTLRELMKTAGGSGQKVQLAPALLAEMPSLQLHAIGARPRSTAPRWPANDRLALQVKTGTVAGASVLLSATTFVDTWRRHILQVAEWNISPAMENLMQAWRDDFMVSKGQFRNLQPIQFSAKPNLEFEFISISELQVRPT